MHSAARRPELVFEPLLRRSSMSRFVSRSRLVLLALACGALAACGSSTPSQTGPAGGPVADAGDPRCLSNGMVQAQPVGMCLAEGAGGSDAAPATAPDYGETLYNSSGYDDDCKYQVSWDSTPIRKNADVTFTVTVVKLDPAGPATNADVSPEVFLSPIHPGDISRTKTTESPAGSGIYKIGPIVFDASGIWTVRFHMYETCSDTPPDSPHGHAAFFIEVP
jgi:hypothetical protein